MTKKEIAVDFETMIVKGAIPEAYDKYVSPVFIHHNPYFKGDRTSLLEGMLKNQEQFSNKEYEILRTLEDGDLVVTHSKLKPSAEMPEMSVIHIYRFEGDRIVEEWDLSQMPNADAINENGLF